MSLSETLCSPQPATHDHRPRRKVHLKRSAAPLSAAQYQDFSVVIYSVKNQCCLNLHNFPSDEDVAAENYCNLHFLFACSM
jgi:hypothetical protein